MNATTRERAETAVQAMAANLTDEALCLAWIATEGEPATKELALVRGWIMDELHRRLGDDLFDEWLAGDENGDSLNPLPFFERKEPLAMPAEPTTHIRQRIARKQGDGFYRVQYGASENGSRTLCGAEPTDRDMAWGECRFAKNLAYVTCGECKQLRDTEK